MEPSLVNQSGDDVDAGTATVALLRSDIGSHGAVTGENPREHLSGCRPGLRQRCACRHRGVRSRPDSVGVCDGAVVASCAYREWRERPCVTQLCVRGSSPQRLGADADSFCSSGRCGREARREVPRCVARAVRRPEGPAARGRPRGRSLAVPRGSQLALATAPGRGSTVGSCSQHLLSVPPPPCSTRRLHGASASFRSTARTAGYSTAQPGRASSETACDDPLDAVHGHRKEDRAHGHRSQRARRGSHATTSAGAGRRPGAQATAA